MFQDGQLFAHLTVARNVGYAAAAAAARRGVGEPGRVSCSSSSACRLRRPAARHPVRRRAAAGRAGPGARGRAAAAAARRAAVRARRRAARAAGRRPARILAPPGPPPLLVTHDHEEAFAVADRMAVMRAGRVVQQRHARRGLARPVDAETACSSATRACSRAARPRVLARPGCRRVRGGAAPLGPGGRRRRARCRPGRSRARSTPEQVRLVVDVDGVGEVDAVAPLDGHVAVGDEVGCASTPPGSPCLGATGARSEPP